MKFSTELFLREHVKNRQIGQTVLLLINAVDQI